MSLPAYPTAESARLISCLDGQNGTEPQRWLRSACLQGGGASHGNNRLAKERVKHVGSGGGWGGVVCAVTKQRKPCPSQHGLWEGSEPEDGCSAAPQVNCVREPWMSFSFCASTSHVEKRSGHWRSIHHVHAPGWSLPPQQKMKDHRPLPAPG